MAPPFCKLARQKGDQGHTRRPKDDFLRILHGFGSIFRDFGHLQMLFQRLCQGFGIIFRIIFTGRQERPRTSKEPGTQRTPQNMILQIAIRTTPSTANKRIPRTALAQNGGRRCHAAWRIQ